jgi:hypothetical protein
MVDNSQMKVFIDSVDEAIVNIQNDLLARGLVNCFPAYMIEQIWRLI